MGLVVDKRNISSDASIFGQIYLFDSEATFYDDDQEEDIECFVKANTIVVDPKYALDNNFVIDEIVKEK